MSRKTPSSSSSSSSSSSRPAFTIPFPYKLWNAFIEPLSAFVAIILALTSPTFLLSGFTPSSSPNILCHAHTSLSPHTSLLLHQTLALYALFVVLEGVVLHWVSHTRTLDFAPEARVTLWRLVMCACLASDVFYLGAAWWMYRTCGAEELFWRPDLWTWREWMNLGMTWLPFVQRICFVSGVGLDGVKRKVERKVDSKEL